MKKNEGKEIDRRLSAMKDKWESWLNHLAGLLYAGPYVI